MSTSLLSPLLLQKLDSDPEDVATDNLINPGSFSINCDSNIPPEVNSLSHPSSAHSQQQKLQQRSFLHKFEQDYMTPIFGGPDVVR